MLPDSLPLLSLCSGACREVSSLLEKGQAAGLEESSNSICVQWDVWHFFACVAMKLDLRNDVSPIKHVYGGVLAGMVCWARVA